MTVKEALEKLNKMVDIDDKILEYEFVYGSAKEQMIFFATEHGEKLFYAIPDVCTGDCEDCIPCCDDNELCSEF